jgi:hypothetical protein
MILHTELFTPRRFAAGTQFKMALFRMNNTAVTLSKRLETGITVPLIKTLAADSATVHTVDFAGIP